MMCFFRSVLLTASLAVSLPNWGACAQSLYNTSSKAINYPEAFRQVIDVIKKDYVEEVSDRDLYEAAISGMLTSLDPHSTFFDAGEYGELQSNVKGEFAGLGIEITMKHGYVTIVSPYEGSPAFRRGLKVGDIITAIDGEIIQGITLQAAAAKLKGAPGSIVKLTIYRESTGESIDMEIAREIIKIMPVKVNLIDNEVLYIHMSAFHQNTAKEALDGIVKIVNETGLNKLRGAILDMRWNPGGLFDQAVAVSNLFLDKGEIVSIRGRSKDSEQKYDASGSDILRGLPMVVIVNGGSASASEIVAGALQDNNRAVVIGTPTFGKGSIQQVIQITKDTAIKLTTSRYYTPKGHAIQAKGIVPDIVVNEAEVRPVGHPNAVTEAALHKHLPEEKGRRQDKRQSAISESSRIKDFQLLRAIDLVKGMSIYKPS
ncbi:MAG: S41 family peptidase [Proteobacteria bacterium]|nr:S41 family peptidase [Pseudomonadota bacterium]